MTASMDLETQLGEAMRAAAGSVRPPVEDLVRLGERRGVALRRRRSRYGVALAGSAGLVAAAVFAVAPQFGRDAATPAAGKTTLQPQLTGCTTAPSTGPLPDWASAGFTDPQAGGTPFVVGTQGNIAAILFGQPLTAPEDKDRANKILWVSRGDQIPLAPLLITAKAIDPPMYPGVDAGEVVQRRVDGGPGPSYLELPRPGCWRLYLSWDNGKQHDTMDLRYVKPGS